jgi:hypothetical protein
VKSPTEGTLLLYVLVLLAGLERFLLHSIMAEEVWVQLYIGGDKSGRVFQVRLVGAKQNIDNLADAVHQANGKSLGHCDARQLDVYKAGTEFPTKEEDKLEPWWDVPKDTTGESPLCVLAPGKNYHAVFASQGDIYSTSALMKIAFSNSQPLAIP